MPFWVHEWIVAPGALALAFVHARRALGAGRAAAELAVLVAYGFGLEWAAMATFSAYRYGDAWTLAPDGVPLAVAIVWAALISSAMSLAARIVSRPGVRRALTAATIAVALDLLMEPVASRLGLWVWTPPGAWLGVPIGNFVGWVVVVGGYTLGCDRRGLGRTPLATLCARIGVSAASIAALIAVGFSWRLLRAESLFAGGAGWLGLSVFLLAPIALTWRRDDRSRDRETPVSRLGLAPGPLPLIVFVWIFGAFAIDALMLAEPALILVGAGAAGSLLVALRAVYLNSFLKLVRAESLGESASSS
jgi:hypothetical protein